MNSEINAFIFKAIPRFSMSAGEYLITVIVRMYWKHLNNNLRVLFFKCQYLHYARNDFSGSPYIYDEHFQLPAEMYSSEFTLTKFF